VFHEYGKDITIVDPGGAKRSLPSDIDIRGVGKSFLLPTNIKIFNLDKILNYHTGSLFCNSQYFDRCAVIDCTDKDIEIYQVRRLNRKAKRNGLVTILNNSEKKSRGFSGDIIQIEKKTDSSLS